MEAKDRKPAARPAAPSRRPFMRFYFSESLHRKTLALLGTIERSRDPAAHGDALAELVVELANTGLDQFFMTPLKRAGAGFVMEQSASLGLKGVQQVMATVIRQIVGRMDGPQLLSVCESIRLFMR